MTRPAEIARGPGLVGMTAVLLGGLAVLVAIVALDWYSVDGGLDAVPAVRFRDLAATADHLDLPWLVPAYFDWLAWILLIAVIVVGMVANTPLRATGVLRGLGGVVGAGGALLTYFALEQIKSYGDEGTYAFHHAAAGVWVTLCGFLVAGIGAVSGPRRI